MTEQNKTTAEPECMWCRYGDHPSGPKCPIHQTPFNDSEYDEIMRLHIVDGHTIDGAMLLVFSRRLAASQEPLGREFEEVLSKNLEALYVRS